MAVTMTAKRNHVFKGTNGTQEISTATLTGSYVAGGFTFDTKGLTGGSGSSPYGGAPINAQWQSPLGYTYVSTFGTGATASIMTTKIFSAANTEFTGTPETTVPFVLTRRLIY